MARYLPPLRHRILTAMRNAKQPCTRGQLFHLGCLRHNLGESSADLQAALDALVADGTIYQATIQQSYHGPMRQPGTAYQLDDEIADFKPIRLRREN